MGSVDISDLPPEIIDKIIYEHLPAPMRSVVLFVRPFSVCLHESRESSLSGKEKYKQCLLFYAAKNGYTSLFLWAYSQCCNHRRFPCLSSMSSRILHMLGRFAAQGGSVDILDILKQEDNRLNYEIYIGGIKGGHIPVINWAIHESIQQPTQMTLRHTVMKKGDIRMLKFLLLTGLIDNQWEEWDLYIASKRGHLEILQYVVEHGASIQLDVKLRIYQGAIQSDSIPILDWLWELDSHSIPNPHVENASYTNNENEIILTTSHPIAHGAISKIYTKVISGISLCRDATLFTRLAVLKWLHEHNFPWDSSCFLSAIGGRFLNDRDDEDVAIKKSFDIIKYLVQEKCLWDSSVCTRAVEIGDLELLRYLHIAGCPWDVETFAIAKYYGNEKMMMYLQKEGCPIDNSIRIRVLDT